MVAEMSEISSVLREGGGAEKEQGRREGRGRAREELRKARDKLMWAS